MDFRLEKLGPNFRKQEEPACAACGYEAEYIVQIRDENAEGTRKSIERLFCERDMRDALLDAINFSTAVPDSLP